MQKVLAHRNVCLDLTKGLAIIIVVLGHALQYAYGEAYAESGMFYSNPVYKTIYAFHMPLLMGISGYLFYGSNQKPLGQLLSSKLKAIGLPMVVFVLLCKAEVLYSLISDDQFFAAASIFVRSICQSYTMWFLFSLLLNIFVVAVLTRLVKGERLQMLCMFLLFVASLFVPDTLVLDVHKYMFPFFCLGYVLKGRNVVLYRASSHVSIMLLLTVLSIGAVWWFDKETYIYTSGFCVVGRYTEQLLIDGKRMLIAAVLSYTVLQYVYLLSKIGRFAFLQRLGQVTLFIYGMNMVVDVFYPKCLAVFSLNFECCFLPPMLFVIGVLSVSLLLEMFLSKSTLTRLLFLGRLK